MKEQSRYVGRFESIPKDIIKGVYVNKKLAQNTYDIKRGRLLDVEEIIEKASYFAFGSYATEATPTDNKKLQGPGMHRGFIVRFGSFQDEHGVIHGQISVKGSGMTLRGAMHYAPPPYGTRNPHFRPTGDPLGFFGVRHAQQDTKISDNLATYGARVSRGLAVISLDPKKLLTWYSQVDYKNTKYDVLKMLSIVKKNGDEPCLMVRLLGAERDDDAAKALFAPKTVINSGVIEGNKKPFTSMPVLLRAIGIVEEEARQRGGFNKFQEVYGIPDIVMGKIVKAAKQPTILAKLDALRYLQVYFFNRNRGIGEVVTEKEYGGGLVFNLHNGNYDMLGSWVDFENSLLESGQLMNSLQEPAPLKQASAEKEDIEINKVIYAARETGRSHALKVASTLPNA